jgi:soluble lytic murein transglycosylase
MRYLDFFLIPLIIGLLVPCKIAAMEKADLDTQRAIFIRAEHALKKHDRKNYELLAKTIGSYPLYPYLIYEDLKQQLKANPPTLAMLEKIAHFEQQFSDFPHHTTLRNQWLLNVAETKKWDLYTTGYRATPNEKLQCHYHYAQYQLTHKPEHLQGAKALWLVGYIQPAECNALFTAWHKAGLRSEKMVWDKLELALEEKNFTLAHELIKELPAAHRSRAKLWISTLKNPFSLLEKKQFDQWASASALEPKILAQGLRLLARNDPVQARLWWEQHNAAHAFTQQQSTQIQRDIGVYLAHQKSPDARDWLKSMPQEALDTTLLEWRIRLALYEEDWKNALHWIELLSEPLKSELSWRYWKARSLEALGQNDAARVQFHSLAKLRNYYGFLSSIRLKQVIALQHRAPHRNPIFLTQVNAIPGIERFEQLSKLRRTGPARIEWFRALEKMNEEQKIACAYIADKMHLHDIAIATLNKTAFKDDVTLRFPLAHHTPITTYSHKYNLDPAWIYAIVRQESAFFNDAISHAGARGLMQLLPSTAKTLIKQYDIAYDGENSLHNPEINIPLGTAYLQDLKRRTKDNTILATASYNAGPTRVSKWYPQKTLDADVWIETIPYKETREYIKNVLAFTAIYHYRLEQPTGLKELMKPIPARQT